MSPHRGRKIQSFGTASRTITLDLSAWAKLYEAALIMEVDYRLAIEKAIGLLFAQTKKTEEK